MRFAKTLRSPVLQYIVFDLFHTLVDDDEYRPKDFRRVERVAGLLQVDLGAFSAYWTDTLALRNTRPSPGIRLVEEYLSKLGKTRPHELLSHRPEVVSALKSLTGRGFKLGILSDCHEREVHEWKRSPLSPFFEAACFSYDIGHQKPDREAYQMILEELGASPSESAYVGGGGSSELDGARTAGFGLIAFMRGFVSRNSLRTAAELEMFQTSADVSIDALLEWPRLFGHDVERGI